MDFDRARGWAATRLLRAANRLDDWSENLRDLAWKIEARPPTTTRLTWADSIVTQAYDAQLNTFMTRPLIFERYTDDREEDRSQGSFTFPIHQDLDDLSEEERAPYEAGGEDRGEEDREPEGHDR